MPDTDATTRARRFLAGERLKFAQANELWKQLKAADQLSLARRVLERVRRVPNCLIDRVPPEVATKNRLCREEALLTSKDVELDAATRHDLAFEILQERFDVDDSRLDGDGETL